MGNRSTNQHKLCGVARCQQRRGSGLGDTAVVGACSFCGPQNGDDNGCDHWVSVASECWTSVSAEVVGLSAGGCAACAARSRSCWRTGSHGGGGAVVTTVGGGSPGAKGSLYLVTEWAPWVVQVK